MYIYGRVMTLTTIGYGDITPYTNTERIISLLYIFVGVAFVSYCIGSLSSIMLSRDSRTRKLKVIHIYIYPRRK